MPVPAASRLPRLAVTGPSRRGAALAEYAGLCTSGLLAGAFVFGRCGLRPAVAALPAAAHIAMRQSLIRSLHRMMPPLMLSALGSAGLAAVLSRRADSIALRCLALACAGISLAVTRFGNVPLNGRILTWTPDAPPSDWTDAVSQWESFDSIRALAAVAAFLCQLGAAMCAEPGGRRRRSRS